MKTLAICALGLAAAAMLPSCIVPVEPHVVSTDVGYYSTLPAGYSSPTYYYGNRYYYGGRYDVGRYYYRGRYYDNRYYHGGRYFYGGMYRTPGVNVRVRRY
jgi:hypothetical protein